MKQFEFNRSIMIDIQGGKITSDMDFLWLREIDERFGILSPIEFDPEIQGPGLQQTLSASKSGIRLAGFNIGRLREPCLASVLTSIYRTTHRHMLSPTGAMKSDSSRVPD